MLPLADGDLHDRCPHPHHSGPGAQGSAPAARAQRAAPGVPAGCRSDRAAARHVAFAVSLSSQHSNFTVVSRSCLLPPESETWEPTVPDLGRSDGTAGTAGTARTRPHRTRPQPCAEAYAEAQQARCATVLVGTLKTPTYMTTINAHKRRNSNTGQICTLWTGYTTCGAVCGHSGGTWDMPVGRAGAAVEYERVASNS